jgi:hypothetical protein
MQNLHTSRAMMQRVFPRHNAPQSARTNEHRFSRYVDSADGHDFLQLREVAQLIYALAAPYVH